MPPPSLCRYRAQYHGSMALYGYHLNDIASTVTNVIAIEPPWLLLHFGRTLALMWPLRYLKESSLAKLLQNNKDGTKNYGKIHLTMNGDVNVIRTEASTPYCHGRNSSCMKHVCGQATRSVALPSGHNASPGRAAPKSARGASVNMYSEKIAWVYLLRVWFETAADEF